MFRILMIATAASSLLGHPCRASSSAEAEVRTYVLQIIDRFNRHEIRPAASPGFSADANFINVEGRWMRNVEDIRRVHAAANKDWMKDAQIKLIELEIRFIRPDVAVVHQLHEMSGSRHPDGTALPPHRQISTRVLVKEQGNWITTAFQNTIVDQKQLERIPR